MPTFLFVTFAYSVYPSELDKGGGGASGIFSDIFCHVSFL